MKPFSAFVKNNPAIMERIKQVKQETIQHPDIKQFLEAHPEVTDEMIDKDLTILQEYKDQSKRCERCESYGQCINFVKGHTPILYIEEKRIKVSYTPCPNKKLHDEEMQMKEYVTAMHVPYETLNAKMDSIYMEPERYEIIEDALRIAQDIKDGKPTKGMYLHGGFGTGKSFILGAIANEMKDKHIYTTIFYVPEFLRDLKAGFTDNTYEQKLERVKRSPVLMLDDIGAEDLTPWVRDEVLGPLLHYRMMNQLPTFFSSNFNFDELEYHLQKTKNGTEKTKALRMMERIRALSEPYELNGKNYRRS